MRLCGDDCDCGGRSQQFGLALTTRRKKSGASEARVPGKRRAGFKRRTVEKRISLAMGDGTEGVVTRLKGREGRRGDEEKEVGRQSNDWLVSLNFLVPCAMDLAAGKHDPLAENQTRCGCCVSALETGGFRAHLSHHTSSPSPISLQVLATLPTKDGNGRQDNRNSELICPHGRMRLPPGSDTGTCTEVIIPHLRRGKHLGDTPDRVRHLYSSPLSWNALIPVFAKIQKRTACIQSLPTQTDTITLPTPRPTPPRPPPRSGL